ncbi:CBS domain-containing protein [Candidatus Nitronereus thalassa]|uniref:CBS domain-containing protein n=1 Tax=Candidatus Nitronereus thalassa TaxID=3020898 RepID=A0ABU3KC89_9BACT|nr:CBS domain-containing protein [Candidatus Nitronereus thalassa]MDT7044047.1 CBS domain-containing protein [Candidatus Nitronereus thalassa]
MDLITTHLNADFDGLASMVAARKLFPGAILAFPSGAQEHVRRFLAVHDVGLMKLKDVNLDEIQRLILVDVQEPERIGRFQELFHNPKVPVHIFDHHPEPIEDVTPSLSNSRFHRVVDSVGASVTILLEQLQAQQITLTPFEATVLAIGLYDETGSLRYNSTTPRDLEAAAVLLRAQADLTMVTAFMQTPLDPERVALLNDLLRTGETVYVHDQKVLLAASTYDRYQGDLSSVAEQLAHVEGYDAIIALMPMEDKFQLVARSKSPELNVGKIAEHFGGGGHPQASSATIKGKTLVEVTEQVRERLLLERDRTLCAAGIMTTPVRSAKQDATILETERAMTRLGVNVLPVLNAKKQFLGLVSRETIQKALFHQMADLPLTTILQTDVYTATPETPFHDIQTHMLERNQRFVPILKGRRVIGVFTRTDLLRTLHHDILEAAHAPVKATGPTPSYRQRNVKNLLHTRLPEDLYTLLVAMGEQAEKQQVGLYLVGGCVRDLILNIPNLDIDLVVEGNGIAFAKSFAKHHGARVKTHDRFGTATVTCSETRKLDIATARTEYYEYPTALPTVEDSSIKKDLYRRDFTINTLAICLTRHRFGELVDFYGGQRDLHDKIIRVLHSLSFIEDPTRVFRAIRFQHRLGFRLGKETSALIKGAVTMDLFERLSPSRLLNELILLLSEPKPRNALEQLAEFNLLQFIHPQLRWSSQLSGLLHGVEESIEWYTLLYLDRPMDSWVVYWMALMEVLPSKAVRDTSRRFPLPQQQVKKLQWIGREASIRLRKLSKHPPLKPAQVYRTLCDLPDEAIVFLMAKTQAESVKRQISAFFTSYQRIHPILNGTDLKAMGLKPGPQFRAILEKLLDARLNGEITSESDERTLANQLIRTLKK